MSNTSDRTAYKAKAFRISKAGEYQELERSKSSDVAVRGFKHKAFANDMRRNRTIKCLTCKYSKVTDIFDAPTCKLKNHKCVGAGAFEYEGKVRSDSGQLEVCQDGVKVGEK